MMQGSTYADTWPLMGGIVGVVDNSDDLSSGSAEYVSLEASHSLGGCLMIFFARS